MGNRIKNIVVNDNCSFLMLERGGDSPKF